MVHTAEARKRVGNGAHQPTTQAATDPLKPSGPTAVKRLNINLPARSLDELQDLARTSGRTMTEVVRLALSLVHVAVEEVHQGNRLAVVGKEGQLLREILLPR